MKENQRIYVKGDTKRYDEVIKLLEDLGGHNPDFYNGKNEDAYYFINPDGIIDSVFPFRSGAFPFIKEFYKEVKLPRWKPEYGECFYYIDIDGTVTKDRWNDTFNNIRCYEFNNCFITQEEAIEARNKIQELLSNRA